MLLQPRRRFQPPCPRGRGAGSAVGRDGAVYGASDSGCCCTTRLSGYHECGSTVRDGEGGEGEGVGVEGAGGVGGVVAGCSNCNGISGATLGGCSWVAHAASYDVYP